MDLTISVNGPAEELEDYADNPSASDLQNLFYGISDGQIGEEVTFGVCSLGVYVAHFEMDGAKFACQVQAENDKDAEKRVEAMRKSLVLDGKLGGIIPGEDREEDPYGSAWTPPEDDDT